MLPIISEKINPTMDQFDQNTWLPNTDAKAIKWWDCFMRVMTICNVIEKYLWIIHQDRRNSTERRKSGNKETPYTGIDCRKKVERRNIERRVDSRKWDNGWLGYQSKRQIDITPFNKEESIKEMEQMLENITWSQEILKIRIYLILVKLYSADNEKIIQEKYFYNALKIAIKYLWKQFNGTEEEKNIIAVYLSNIDSTHQKSYRDSPSDDYLWVLYSTIISEYRVKTILEWRKEETTMNTLWSINHNVLNESLEELDTILPYWVHLRIISHNTGIILLEYRWSKQDKWNLNELSQNMRSITLDILGKEETYWYSLRANSQDNDRQYSDIELETIIEPRIESIIKNRILQLIWESVEMHNLLESTLENIKKNKLLEMNIDYSNLIKSIVWKDENLLENREYYNDLSKAINITNKIVFWLSKKSISPQEIDSILWGNINRSILDMVSTLLLNIHETPLGLGYPFGHNKKIIPLEWQIYQIIRANTILSLSDQNNTTNSLNAWAKIGFFESDILRLFFENQNKAISYQKSPEYQNTSWPVTAYRSEIYDEYIQKWTYIIHINDTIRKYFHEYQLLALGNRSWVNKVVLKSTILEIGKLHTKLFEAINEIKTALIMRHERAKSDEDGTFGPDNEPISETWEKNAKEIWKTLKSIDIEYILSSWSERAKQTAHIICQTINECGNSTCKTVCEKCPMIQIDRGLENPPKDEYSRYYPWNMRILADKNIWLHKVIKNLMVQLQKGVILIITHRDPARVFLDTLNYTMPNNVKNIIPLNSVIELHLRWNSLIPNWKEEIFFPALQWEPILSETNAICEKVFSQIFHSTKELHINPTRLHKKLLDFCNTMYEKSPEIFERFMEELEQGNHTKHFPNIIRTARVIKLVSY